MRKTEEWGAYFLELMESRYLETREKIKHKYQKNKKSIDTSFLEVVKQLLQKGIEKQKKEEKKRISFFTCYQLNTSIQKKSYEIQMNLYDASFYSDKEDIYGLWQPDFLYEYVEEDMEYFKKKAGQEIFQIRYPQLEEARMLYTHAVSLLLFPYLKEWIPEVISLSEFRELEKEKGFQVLYGEYMGKLFCLYEEKEEKLLDKG